MLACYICHNTIRTRYFARVEPDLACHETCLTCAICQRLLVQSNTCHYIRQVRHGPKFICNSHLTERVCHLCGGEITSGQTYSWLGLSIKVHCDPCLRCYKCGEIPGPGTMVYISQSKLFCQQKMCKSNRLPRNGNNYNTNSKTSTSYIDELEIDDADDDDDEYSNDSSDIIDQNGLQNYTRPPGNLKAQEQRQQRFDTNFPYLRKSLDNGEEVMNTQTGTSDDGCLQGGSHSSRSSKHTRMRTVLSESQLAHLRACYASNPRPDSITKEQLSFLTGLNCRVIRVWFQNKRCKDKKRLLQHNPT